MMIFTRMSLWERFKRLVNSSYRNKQDAETKEALRYLVYHPEDPCIINGSVIVNGSGFLGFDLFANQQKN